MTRPDWSRRLEQVRETRQLSQAALAKMLQVSAMTLSRWERGMNPPSAEHLITLSKLLGPPQCWYFLGRAGLSRRLVQQWLSSRNGA